MGLTQIGLDSRGGRVTRRKARGEIKNGERRGRVFGVETTGTGTDGAVAFSWDVGLSAKTPIDERIGVV